MKSVFLFFLLFFLTACSNQTADDIPYIDYVCVKYKNVSEDKIYQGFIDRENDADLSFSLTGIMNGVYVKEGEYVKKGQILAKLDNDEYKLNIKKAQTEVNDADVKYSRAKSYFERISKLHDAGGISYNDWESAQTNLKTSLNQLNISKDALRIAHDKEKFTNIFAPADGVVIRVYKDKMQTVTAGERVIYFQGKGMLEARVFVPQSDINNIKPNQEIELQTSAIKDKIYKGKIKSKVNSSFDSGSYRVTVNILNDDLNLLDGMSVSVKIKSENDKKKIVVPLSAIVSDTDKNFVYVLEKNTENTGVVHKREITTSDIIGDEIEITGVMQGELIVVSGVNKIMDGSKVKFI